MIIKILLQKIVPYIFSKLWWSLHVLITTENETKHKDVLLNFLIPWVRHKIYNMGNQNFKFLNTLLTSKSSWGERAYGMQTWRILNYLKKQKMMKFKINEAHGPMKIKMQRCEQC